MHASTVRPRAQPRLLPQLLQQLGRSNPSLLALINSNQADFVRLVNEPVSEADLEESLRQSQEHAERARAANTVQVTQAEMQQIERLEQLVGPMGLDRQAVLEAWLACDKNEELAANYLLNNLEDILKDGADKRWENVSAFVGSRNKEQCKKRAKMLSK